VSCPLLRAFFIGKICVSDLQDNLSQRSHRCAKRLRRLYPRVETRGLASGNPPAG
jgi:hypothetical protein